MSTICLRTVYEPPQLPSSPHTLPRHLINVTHRLPSKTEGIVFVSAAADKGFWKADMHNDSAVIASLVWSPFLSVHRAACCCLTEWLSAAVSPENMFGSQIHLVRYDGLSVDLRGGCVKEFPHRVRVGLGTRESCWLFKSCDKSMLKSNMVKESSEAGKGNVLVPTYDWMFDAPAAVLDKIITPQRKNGRYLSSFIF